MLAASVGQESHGESMRDGRLQDVETWIYTDVGRKAKRKGFGQTMHILEARKPGVVKAAGL